MTALLENIFSSKVVGSLFALAFTSWAFVLNSFSDKVLETQADTRNEVMLLKSQIVDLRGIIVGIQIKQAEEITTIRERQNGVLQRLDGIDDYHEHGQSEPRKR